MDKGDIIKIIVFTHESAQYFSGIGEKPTPSVISAKFLFSHDDQSQLVESIEGSSVYPRCHKIVAIPLYIIIYD